MHVEVLLAVPEVDGRIPLLSATARDVDAGDVEELRWFFAGIDSFRLTVSQMHGVVDQEAEVRGLAASLAMRWPEAKPVVVEPRLRADGPHRVPLHTAPREAVLVVDGEERASFPLGPLE